MTMFYNGKIIGIFLSIFFLSTVVFCSTPKIVEPGNSVLGKNFSYPKLNKIRKSMEGNVMVEHLPGNFSLSGPYFLEPDVLQSEEEGSLHGEHRIYSEAEAMRMLEEGEQDEDATDLGREEQPPPLPQDPPPAPINPIVIVTEHEGEQSDSMEHEEDSTEASANAITGLTGPTATASAADTAAGAAAAPADSGRSSTNGGQITGAQIFGTGNDDTPSKKKVTISSPPRGEKSKKKRAPSPSSSSSSGSSSSSSESSSSSSSESDSDESRHEAGKESVKESEREEDTDDRGSLLVSENAHSALPPLYYTVKTARESVMAPRVLGGGASNRNNDRFGDLSTDPRHTMATHRHIDEKKINVGTSFDPVTMICYTCYHLCYNLFCVII